MIIGMSGNSENKGFLGGGVDGYNTQELHDIGEGKSTGPVEPAVRRKCAIHDKDENVVPWTAYLQCPECWHVYLTEEEFVVAYNEVRRQANVEFRRMRMTSRAKMATKGDEVTYCGLCLHDIPF